MFPGIAERLKEDVGVLLRELCIAESMEYSIDRLVRNTLRSTRGTVFISRLNALNRLKPQGTFLIEFVPSKEESKKLGYVSRTIGRGNFLDRFITIDSGYGDNEAFILEEIKPALENLFSNMEFDIR